MKKLTILGLVGFLGSLGVLPGLAQTLWSPGGTVGNNTTNSNVGIGTATPAASLDVVGRTLKVSNLYPEYKWAFGGGQDLNWKTIANVTLGTGTYTGVSFVVSVLDASNNAGASVAAIPMTYYVAMTRSIAVQDSPNNAQVSGPVNDYVRVVKTTTGIYELQVRQPSDWRHMTVGVRAYSINSLGTGGSIAYVTSPANGSTVGDIYTRSLLHREYFTAGYFAGNVGINTTLPAAKLHVIGEDAGYSALFAGASKALRIHTTSGGAFISGTDHTGSGSYQPLFVYGSLLSMGINGVEKMRMDSAGNIGIGTSTPGSYKLAVNGTIRAKEVIVDTGWADYVFAADYKLAPLAEVESHIKEKGHLPGIPSAKEVAEHGVSMGEMQAKLLAKIEELTLHMIDMKKELVRHTDKIEQLETENQSLRNSL